MKKKNIKAILISICIAVTVLIFRHINLPEMTQEILLILLIIAEVFFINFIIDYYTSKNN